MKSKIKSIKERLSKRDTDDDKSSKMEQELERIRA